MSALTPSLTDRNAKRDRLILDIRNNATGRVGDLLRGRFADQHLLRSTHPDAAQRAAARTVRRAVNETVHRFLTLEARIKGFDLTKSADWTALNALTDQGYAPFDLKRTLASAFTGYATLPVVTLSTALEEEWAYQTTAHEIHEAFEAEVRALIGSDIHFLGTTIITVPQNQVDGLTELRWRRDTMLALTTPPDDPYDPDHWGHDATLSSLALTPTQGAGITLSPAFASGTRKYTMPNKGNQVLRVDAATTDSRASFVVTKEAHRVVVRVTAKMGDTLDYVIEGDNEAKLTSLVFGPAPGSNYPFTPAFDADTLTYTTTAPLAGILNVAASASTPGATVTWSKDATGVDVVVTAADGKTTRTYRITSSHSG